MLLRRLVSNSAAPLVATAARRHAAVVGAGIAVVASGTAALCLEESKQEAYLGRNFVANAASLALPAVVNITSQVQHHTFLGVQQAMSAGSGFIVSEDGLVVTNAHVVSHGNNIKVNLNDGRQTRGKLLAMDRSSDVALVKIENARDLPVAKIGSSSHLRPGDFVVALGSPLNLSNSVTCGIVSAVARHGSEIGIVQQRAEYIQTDAAINVGNSGGPLVDLDGKVIGINTMKAQRADGISFAIPIDTAWQVVRQLLKHGRVARPYVGFKMVAVRDARGVLGGEPDEDRIVVAQIMPGSPADRAGVRAGDVILEFDGAPVRAVPDILARIGFEAQQKIRVKIFRPASSAFSSHSVFEVTIVTQTDMPPDVAAATQG
ncbi:hypothetical protein CTAYLR_001199 [Chrysophaeum taylorii]|uniref:PDZ domain-containing protein n=1 Tax=Chrysophaeum taylorii TaxID=2483200 RepID=A0AAD7UDE0_9STRA|nr:hypothetical protein CTAYLR_001199 [Chrysophaeum taylorii]